MRLMSSSLSPSCDRVSFDVEIDGKSLEIYFTSEDAPLVASLDAILILGLLPSMKRDVALNIDGEVSKQLISSIAIPQDIYAVWEPSFHRVPIENAQHVRRTKAMNARVGTFFSGGVDSFYTLLKHDREITDIVLVHGFDINLADEELFLETATRVKDAAAQLGKHVIEVKTNLRELLNPYVGWGPLGHGPGLAAVGHVLSTTIHKLYIPSTHSYADLYPWGSHLILDRLWSSESIEFVHDGSEATRVAKVGRIAECGAALRTLRVCTKNPGGAYNCGKCEKCLRTMINLKVADALDRCETFNAPLSIRRVCAMPAINDNQRSFVRENLLALKQSTCPSNRQLRTALAFVLAKPVWPSKASLWLRSAIGKNRVASFFARPIYNVIKSLSN